MKSNFFWIVFLVSLAGSSNGFSQISLHVKPNEIRSTVSPQMWGIFFEDINFAADGGLYAELVKNGSFQFPLPFAGWKVNKPDFKDKVLVVNQAGVKNGNTRYVRITKSSDSSVYNIVNEGFRGIGLHKNAGYTFSIRVKTISGNLRMRVEVLRESGQSLARGDITSLKGGWANYDLALTASDPESKGILKIAFLGKGVVEIDHISLFPVNTYKNRPGGLRADLVAMLDSLKPGFVRFPGGCIVEGHTLASRYQWKKTVGPKQERELSINRWNMEFPRRAAPDYYQSFGLGFYEYFQLSEDLGAEPLPILNCGMACQFNSGEVAAVEDLGPYIQDALDLIEFANGAVQTKWGKLRADMGHPAPFNLKMIGVGNEQWDEQYFERYRKFEQALKAKYPDIQLVSSSGPSAQGNLFDYAWSQLRDSKAGFVDEHYYLPPAWFFANARRYDQYDRNRPKVFAGEYAAHDKEEVQPESRNTWQSALAEAAFMTGLERNADLVRMCSYAPLLAHVEAWQWRPDLIWFDNLRTMATPNYYVQKLFSTNRGSHVIPVTLQDSVVAGQDSIYASAVLDKNQNQVIVKLVNIARKAQKIEIRIDGLPPDKFQARGTVLSSSADLAFNRMNNPGVITPRETSYDIEGGVLASEFPARSVQVIVLQYGSIRR